MKNNKRFQSVFALFLAVVMVVCVLPTSAAAAKSSAAIQEELNGLKDENKKIQAEIDAIQAKYDANANEILNLVNKKSAIDQEISLLNSQLLNLNQQITVYGQMIADAQDELEVNKMYLNGLNEKHKDRIRVMEEEGGITYWEVIFQANSFTDLLDRLTLMEEIAASDQRRLEEMRLVAADVIASQHALESGKAELENSRNALAGTQEELEAKRGESDDVIRELVKKSEEFQLLLDESEQAQDDLMKDIAKKEKELKEAKYEEELARLALQGQNPPSSASWITPVSGYRLTSPFGMRKHPVLGTNRMHNGVDMACSQGTPIYATRAGKVTTAAYQAGGAGNYVSINHLDGFASIYMHMTHYVVKAGQTVTAGQLIGYVGSTGISTGPHLHFGISYAGTYVNPLAYIR